MIRTVAATLAEVAGTLSDPVLVGHGFAEDFAIRQGQGFVYVATEGEGAVDRIRDARWILEEEGFHLRPTVSGFGIMGFEVTVRTEGITPARMIGGHTKVGWGGREVLVTAVVVTGAHAEVSLAGGMIVSASSTDRFTLAR